MNADEFSALVERHPLPWDLDVSPNDGEERAYWSRQHPLGLAVGECVPLERDDIDGLADAAPALAAAAIRLLKTRDASAASRDDLIACVAALRAALPPELRP